MVHKLRFLLGRYSYLKIELGDKLYDIVTNYVISEAISIQEMERLVEVVQYKH